MEKGVLKKGDIVVFTEEAKKKIDSAVDNKLHIVSEVIKKAGQELIVFKDSLKSDSHWLKKITMITEDKIKQGQEEAYKAAGDNAYFGNGFKAGVKFAMEQMKEEDTEKKVDELQAKVLGMKTSIKSRIDQLKQHSKEYASDQDITNARLNTAKASSFELVLKDIENILEQVQNLY